ncbi:unnamed protein product [Closterium sp. NIES-54]
MRPRPYFVPLLQQVLGTPPPAALTPPLRCPPPDQSQPPLQPASPLPAPSPYTEQSGGLTERRELASRLVLPVRTACRVPHSRPPPVPGTHAITLHPSSVPLRVPLPAPPESSLPKVPDPESDRARAASLTISRLLATAVTDPSFESTAVSALVAAACRLDYATSLVAESTSASPPSIRGECALGTDVLEDSLEDFECLAAAVPRFATMLLAPEGDPDSPDIPTPRSYAETITVSRMKIRGPRQDSSGSTAAPAGPSSRQQKQGQVAAGAAAGGATVAAGGSCRCLTVFPPPSLTLPPTAAQAAVRERGGVVAGFEESLSPPSHTPPVSLHPPPATSPPPSRRIPLKEGVGRAAGNSHPPPPHLPPPTAKAAEGKGGAALAAAHAGVGDGHWCWRTRPCANGHGRTQLRAAMRARTQLRAAAAVFVTEQGGAGRDGAGSTGRWQAAMDAEMASWKSTGTYVDEVPLPGANIVDGMWIFRVKRPPGSPPAFKACYVARGFSTQWSLRRPVYGLHQAPPEWHDTLRTTLATHGFAPASADLSLFLRTDTSLPPFYVLVYVDDLVFATGDTEALTLVKSELKKRHTCINLGELRSYLGLQITRDRTRRTITLTQSHMGHQFLQRFGIQFSSPQPTPLSTSHSLSAPPLDESVEPSGPYPELVGCLMYLMTCTRPNLAYPLSLLARYVAPGRHQKVH